MENINSIPNGQDIIYCNPWRSFDCSSIESCFEKLEDINSLVKGDVIWINQEPYYVNGKVKGLTKATVTNIEKIEGRRKNDRKGKKISHTGGYVFIEKGESFSRFYKLINEEKLLQLIKDNPLSLYYGDPLVEASKNKHKKQ